jgi:dCMP deaminase
MSRWDKYFHDMCIAASSKSSCLSRKIGAILVKDKSIVSIGFNGPPRGVPHCGNERWLKDKYLREYAKVKLEELRWLDIPISRFSNECPRRVMGFESGTHMEFCPAQHAEENAVSNAARNGVSILGCTLYMNSVIPCQKCFGTLINAGIAEIVIESAKVYDEHTQFLINNSSIKTREFEL